MSYSAKILLDSVSETGKRLTTFEITLPRIVLSEFNTHRVFSRNSASSRAIPFAKQLSYVISEPFIPDLFPINGKGMQPQEYYDPESKEHLYATDVWLSARDSMVKYTEMLTGKLPAALIDSGSDLRSDKEVFLNVHKQIANRLLEPFLWHKILVTSTEWNNFFKLRTHTDAQREIRTIADLMYDAYHYSQRNRHEYIDHHNFCLDCNKNENHVIHNIQQKLRIGEWHCPLVYKNNSEALAISEYLSIYCPTIDTEELWTKQYEEIEKKISVARCARISYLTHDGKRDILKDLELFERLRASGHWSPFEHVATPYFNNIGKEAAGKLNDIFELGKTDLKGFLNLRSGNFIGWKQMRKEFSDENCTDFRKN